MSRLVFNPLTGKMDYVGEGGSVVEGASVTQHPGNSTTLVMSQAAVTAALAGKLEVINAEPYFRNIPDFSDNTVVPYSVIPYGPRIAYEFPNATPKPLLALYDSENVTDNTIVYKGFMIDPLRCITLTFDKNEYKMTSKITDMAEKSDISGGILPVKSFLSARPSDWGFSETFVQESRDGDVIYIFDQKSNTGAFWYMFLSEAGITCCCKKWYNSYLYNDDTGYAKTNNLFYCEDLNSYFTLRDSVVPIEFLDYKLNKSDIATTLGDSEKKVISQKAVTDALANKIDKNDFETKLKDKLSVVDLSSISNLEFIKDSKSNGAYRMECNLSEIFKNIDYRNVIFTIFSPLLVDTTTSNVTILSTGKNFCFSFARYLNGKYYYDMTVSNLELYKEGEDGVFKKYNSALITLVLDIQENILELHFEDANKISIITIDDWVNGDNVDYNESDGYIMISSFYNQRVIITKTLDIDTGFVTPFEVDNTSTFEFIFSTGDTVPQIAFFFDYKWAKEPTFNPNKTYAVTIEGNNVNGEMEYLAMYAEFDYLNT